LLSSIDKTTCLPFIGRGAHSCIPYSDPEEKSPHRIDLNQISNDLSTEHGYPLEDPTDLSHVAQFMAIKYRKDIVPKNDLSEILSKIEPPDFSLEKYHDTPYSVLTELKLPIYITTNYDHFMEAALISRGGRQPVSDFCRWNEYLLKDEVYTDLSKNFSKFGFSFGQTKLSSILDQDSEYKPTVDRPLVYHLYGDIAAPESMVLTEKDYFDFVISLNKYKGTPVLHPIIRLIITSTPLLLIGYRLESMSFRILLRSMSAESPFSNIAVLPMIAETVNNNRARAYLTRYVRYMFNTNAIWIDTYRFSSELRTRWNTFKNMKL